jgi:excisionase family DNA binding protein
VLPQKARLISICKNKDTVIMELNAACTSGNSPTFEPLLSDKEVAKILGLHHKTIQYLARTGAIPSIKIGRFWRFRASSLDSWIQEQQAGVNSSRQNSTRVVKHKEKTQ